MRRGLVLHVDERRDGDPRDPERVRRPLVGGREVAAFRRRQPGGLAEGADVLLQGGEERGAIGFVPGQDLLVADNAAFDGIDPDQAPELVRLVRLPLADDLRVRLKQAEHLARRRVRMIFCALPIQDVSFDESVGTVRLDVSDATPVLL